MRRLGEERGSILALTALGFAVLFGIAAITIDVGNWYYTQRQLQSLADAAAMAGALEIHACGGAANCSAMQTAAKAALTENGNTPSKQFSQCTKPTGNGLILTINNGPCALSGDPNSGDTNYVEVVVSKQVPNYFAGIFGMPTVNLSARAEAGSTGGGGGGGPCMNIIGTSGQTLTLNSGASITDASGSNCGLQVNSIANGGCGGPAVMENSGATVNVGSYNVSGGVCNNGGTYTPAPTISAATVADPFATEISQGKISAPTQPNNWQSSNPISDTTTLDPGYYPYGLNFNGGGYTVTLNPGVYYFDGGINVGGITINGDGVTIYMHNGQLNMNSASTVNLTAPTSGPTEGLVIWQDAGDSSQMNLDSASNSSWKGGIYIPNAQLTLNGGSYSTAYGMVVAQSVMANSSIVLSCASMPSGSCPGGGGPAVIALSE